MDYKKQVIDNFKSQLKKIHIKGLIQGNEICCKASLNAKTTYGKNYKGE